MARKLKDNCPFRMVHKDCFAQMINGKCFALSKTTFETDTCPFYKTEDKVDPKVMRFKKNADRGLKRNWKLNCNVWE